MHCDKFATKINAETQKLDQQICLSSLTYVKLLSYKLTKKKVWYYFITIKLLHVVNKSVKDLQQATFVRNVASTSSKVGASSLIN